MIIWGSRGITSTLEQAQFHCPQCSAMRTGNLKQVRSFFTLYFIPLVPLNVLGRYVECTSCAGSFAEEILSYDPEQEREELNSQLLRVMVLAGLADGQLDDLEIKEIKKQYLEIAGLPVTDDRLQSESQMAMSSGINLNQYVTSVVGELSPHGKALVVKLAFQTMSASGELQEGHQQQLLQLQQTLGIPDDQFKELITHFSNPDLQ